MASRGFAIYLAVGFLIISIIHCAQVWLNTFRLHCRAEIKPFMEILKKKRPQERLTKVVILVRG